MTRKKMFYLIFIFSTLILFIIVFSLPKIFSTKVGTKFLLKKIENKYCAKIEIESFNLSWFGPQSLKKLSYADTNLDLKVDSIVSNISLFSLYKSLNSYEKLKFFANTDIKDLDINFHFSNLPKASIYNVFASIKAEADKVNSIRIIGKTKEDSKTGNIEASLDFKDKKINAKILGNNIPTIGLDQLLFFNKEKYQNILVQILGPSFDIEIKSTLENLVGPIDIDFNSTNSKAKLNLFYQKDKLTLKEAAKIILDLPEIKPTFIKGISYIKSIEPIIITISEQDFLLPLSPFNLEKLSIKQSTIDLNKMIVSNTGIIKTITNFTKIPAKENVFLWFTNVNLKVENKTLTTDRMDFLINDDLHLCAWGKIDLSDHNLKLNLGLPSDTLTTIFNIQNLSKDYVIKIPISGTLENPKIDAKGATGKIIALTALQKAKGLGSIIGGVLTKIKKDEDIPPPKKPFPWAEKRY